jgi:two-component system NtrC family sensor kinase
MGDPSRQSRGSGPTLRRHLTFRLGVGLCLGTAAILIGAALWNLRTQRAHLQRVVGVGGERAAEVIRSSTRQAMLRNDPDMVVRIIETIAAQEAVERVRIFDKQGRITKSTERTEVGTLVDTDAEQCFACHQRDEPLVSLHQEDRTRIFRGPEGVRILGVIAPIRNEPECSGAPCHAHPASRKVLGVLDVQLSLRSVDQALAASERQLLTGVIVTAVAVLALAWLLTWRMVLRPVRRLTRAAGKVSSGDLSVRIPVTSSDEIGEMTVAWNNMVVELSRARDELEGWGRNLERRVEVKTRELERAHQQMVLVEKMASLGKLAAVVAHEINNPLTGIGTYAKLLRRRITPEGKAPPPSLDGETERVLRMIEEEAGRCGGIVRNLLLFSRTPGARFSREEVPPILERCVMLVRHQAELEEVELRLDIEPDIPRAVIDPAQIQQMVLALVMNALEATPTGGTVKISVRSVAEEDQIEIEVEDTGRGIPQENLNRIFEPFFSTKEEGAGVGLGLAVVYGIVNRHHGKIDVHTSRGEGTRFTIRLPLQQPEETRGPQ